MVISLYFHIPFCTKKCPYCHFFVLPNREQSRHLFKEALLKEWEQRLPLFKNKKILSLYFGGGTPSLYPEVIEAILKRVDRLNCSQNVEVTVEGNPEQINLSLIQKLKTIGVNRISLGVQSLDDRLLKILGRTHNSSQALQGINASFEGGITNISIDLMNELPWQTLESWDKTLTRTQSLPITHLSLYHLTFENNTAFMKRQKALSPHLPSQEESVEMLDMATKALKKMGLTRYEISAFSKKGYESIHNTGYWVGRPFLGFGPSAFSYYNGKRFRNCSNLKKYAKKLFALEDPVDFEEQLPYPANLHEQLAIYLRLNQGVDLKTFSLPQTAYPILKDLQEEGFIETTPSHIKLTDRGRLFYDDVAERIIL